VLGQDAGSDETRIGGVGTIGDPGAEHLAVLDGHEEQTARRVQLTQLLDGEAA
jgi:hypothetical protein